MYFYNKVSGFSITTRMLLLTKSIRLRRQNGGGIDGHFPSLVPEQIDHQLNWITPTPNWQSRYRWWENLHLGSTENAWSLVKWDIWDGKNCETSKSRRSEEDLTAPRPHPWDRYMSDCGKEVWRTAGGRGFSMWAHSYERLSPEWGAWTLPFQGERGSHW